MSRFFRSDEQFAETIGRANAQLVFSGGHGGLVTYDGNGGAMKKEGGPVDRIFLLMNDGRSCPEPWCKSLTPIAVTGG